MFFFRSPLPLLTLVLATGVAAQSPVQSTIYLAPTLPPKDEYTRCGMGYQNVTAVTVDGTFWTIGYWLDRVSGIREARLYRSRDGASSWQQVGKVPSRVAVDASLVPSPDGTTLHVAWQGKETTTSSYEHSIYYAAYDTNTGKWCGLPTILFQSTGTGKYNQYSGANLAMNRQGCICVLGIRGNGWTTFFRLFDGKAWSSPVQLHTGTSYSVRTNVLAGPDDCFHFAYRSGSGSQYDSYYRRYDPLAGAFGAEGQVQARAKTSNEQILHLTPGGDIFITHAVDGALEVAHARLGTWSFKSYQVEKDSTLKAGNTSYYCSVVGGSSGGRVSVFYTLPQENRKAIYARDWTGNGLGARRTVVTGPTNAEFWYHDARAAWFPGEGLHLTWQMRLYDSSTPPKQIGYSLGALIEPAAFVPFGLGCRGSNNRVPCIGVNDSPWLGNGSYALTLADGPPAASALALVGNDRKSFAGIPLPWPLDPLGFTGCTLFTNVILTFAAVTGTGGGTTLPLPLPPDPVLAGAILPSQWLLLDAGAPGGVRFTGGGASIPR